MYIKILIIHYLLKLKAVAQPGKIKYIQVHMRPHICTFTSNLSPGQTWMRVDEGWQSRRHALLYRGHFKVQINKIKV
jgi:hypothetical protein